MPSINIALYSLFLLLPLSSSTSFYNIMPKTLPFPIFRYKPLTPASIQGGVIIVLQEWWGVNKQCQEHAQKLADRTGAHTVIPDLYKGKVGVDAEEASHLMNNLDWKKAIRELEELVDQLKEAKFS